MDNGMEQFCYGIWKMQGMEWKISVVECKIIFHTSKVYLS